VIDSWSPWIALFVAGGPFLLIIVNFAFSLYLSRRHLDAVLVALKNSRYIVFWDTNLRHQGWLGQIMLVAMISGLVMWPGVGIRKGAIDPTEINNFPPYLKRLLIIDLVMTVGAAIWLAIVFVLVKFK
jgi:hypothetical protein